MRILWTDSAQHSQDAAADYIFEEFGAIPLHEFYNSLDEIEENLLFFLKWGKSSPYCKIDPNYIEVLWPLNIIKSSIL